MKGLIHSGKGQAGCCNGVRDIGATQREANRDIAAAQREANLCNS